MRLIDADKLSRPIHAEEDSPFGADWPLGEIEAYNDGIDEAWSKIEKAPTVDAVEVVRCKDCRHQTEKGWCCFHSSCVERYDYCSRGERRDDEDN